MRNEPTLPYIMVVQNRIFIASFVLLSLFLNNVWLLFVPLLANLSCLLFKIHPLFMITKNFLRKEPSAYPQSSFADLHFNQAIVVFFLTISIVAYFLNNLIISLVFSIFVLVAIAIAMMGFCIGCYIRYQINQFKYKHNI